MRNHQSTNGNQPFKILIMIKKKRKETEQIIHPGGPGLISLVKSAFGSEYCNTNINPFQ